MRLWLVIPVKPFGQGKSRMAGKLSPAERSRLSRYLLQRLMLVALDVGSFAGILVVSRDDSALELAQESGALGLLERGEGLNQALGQACQFILDQGADALLVLPADLPQVTVADIHRLVAASGMQRGMVISPSGDGGTNALLLRPPDAIAFAFGHASFLRHIELARQAQLAFQIVESPTLAMDLDRPVDLDALDQAAVARFHMGVCH